MKNIIILTLVSAFQIFFCYASVPISWTVETSRLAPAVFDVVRGETIDLEATFNSSGKPFEVDTEPVSIFWQTNGMGSAWWTAPAAATSNRVSATFTPEMDPGAATVNGFLGSSGSIYRAAFTFRFRHGPGATPNVLPLPTPVIDFAKVRVLNPPWEGGGVNTNAVIDIIHETVSGSARSLPKYLHERSFDDSYPDEAKEYYRSRGNGKTDGGCSAVRDGGFLYRNFDYPFDDRAEFVVKMSAGPNRFASIGVAQVGTNLTETFVISGKPSRCYKWLPGATVDGINENGVVCEVNVVDGDPHEGGWPTNGTIHCLGAVRWVLDNATNAASAAMVLAAEVYFPSVWTQNFHWMIADATSTYIVENGVAHPVTNAPAVMTNFKLYPKTYGAGWERYELLSDTANAITNAWFTRAYADDTYWMSEFGSVGVMETAKEYWRNGSKESHRGQHIGNKWWWQTVHTSVYDISNRALRVAVQEVDDWYTFQVPVSGGLKVETDPVWSAEKSGYQPKISDLDAIRAGASAGATAYQKPSGGIPKSDLADGVKESLGKADTALQSFTEKDPTVGLTNGTIHIKGQAIKPLTSFTEQDPTATAKANAAIAASPIIANKADKSEIPDVSGFVPYTGATEDVNIGDRDFHTYYGMYVGYRTGAEYYTYYTYDGVFGFNSTKGISGNYLFPWAPGYGIDTTRDFALVSQIEAATNGLAQTIPQKINAAVSANLNTYIDGETGVEYVGKFYGGSLYYVPTGNVYPPNN